MMRDSHEYSNIFNLSSCNNWKGYWVRFNLLGGYLDPSKAFPSTQKESGQVWGDLWSFIDPKTRVISYRRIYNALGLIIVT